MHNLYCISVGECPGIVGLLDRHTVNRTHQEVKLCWTHENDILFNYYDIEILCKHQGEVLVSRTCTAAVTKKLWCLWFMAKYCIIL